MTSKEIEHNVEQIVENFSQEEFIYNLLLAYGISKTSITRVKKGDFNLSKSEGEVLYKNIGTAYRFQRKGYTFISKRSF